MRHSSPLASSFAFSFALLGLVSIAASGCDRIDDWLDDIHTGSGGSTGPGMGTAGAGGGAVGGSGGGNAMDTCGSSRDCSMGLVCSTELGRCEGLPGCTPNAPCPAICVGRCVPKPAETTPCGRTTCAAGLVCCNPSCGVCTRPGEGCTLMECTEPTPPNCMADGDCHLSADYCRGCDCRALGKGDREPMCSGAAVQCVAEPCIGQVAACVNGVCMARQTGGGTGGGTGGAGTGGAGGGNSGDACASTASCKDTFVCTTEQGQCDPAPGCGPNTACPAVCYGRCVPRQTPPPAGNCMADTDCRLFSDYCTGCDCRALGRGEPEPKCSSPGVQCLVDPCARRTATCVSGRCTVATAPTR